MAEGLRSQDQLGATRPRCRTRPQARGRVTRSNQINRIPTTRACLTHATLHVRGQYPRVLRAAHRAAQFLYFSRYICNKYDRNFT